MPKGRDRFIIENALDDDASEQQENIDAQDQQVLLYEILDFEQELKVQSYHHAGDYGRFEPPEELLDHLSMLQRAVRRLKDVNARQRYEQKLEGFSLWIDLRYASYARMLFDSYVYVRVKNTLKPAEGVAEVERARLRLMEMLDEGVRRLEDAMRDAANVHEARDSALEDLRETRKKFRFYETQPDALEYEVEMKALRGLVKDFCLGELDDEALHLEQHSLALRRLEASSALNSAIHWFRKGLFVMNRSIELLRRREEFIDAWHYLDELFQRSDRPSINDEAEVNIQFVRHFQPILTPDTVTCDQVERFSRYWQDVAHVRDTKWSDKTYEERERACRILGVEKSFSPQDLKRAFSQAVHKYHPDKGLPSADEERLKLVYWAYELLKT